MAASPGSAPTSPPSCVARSTDSRVDPPGEEPPQRGGSSTAAARAPGCARPPGLLEDQLPRVGFAIAPGRAARSPRGCLPSPPGRSGSRSASAAASISRRRRQRHPEVGFLGVEPFINGVAKLLRAVEQRRPGQCPRADGRRPPAADGAARRQPGTRLRPVPRPLAEAAPPQAADRQCPTRWPSCARVLAPGGGCGSPPIMPDYARWMLAPALAEQAASPGPRGRPATGASRPPTG